MVLLREKRGFCVKKVTKLPALTECVCPKKKIKNASSNPVTSSSYEHKKNVSLKNVKVR
jgi:hypothetical protein